jgi:hypothetical protein
LLSDENLPYSVVSASVPLLVVFVVTGTHITVTEHMQAIINGKEIFHIVFVSVHENARTTCY